MTGQEPKAHLEGADCYNSQPLIRLGVALLPINKKGISVPTLRIYKQYICTLDSSQSPKNPTLDLAMNRTSESIKF